MTQSERSEILLLAYNVKLVRKDESRLMRVLNLLMFWNTKFMDSFWTTITLGPIRIIAYPTRFKTQEDALKRLYTITHEIEHVIQADKGVFERKIFNNIAFVVKYLVLYLPIILAWFRYDYEVKAYLKGYRTQIICEQWEPQREKLDEWVEWVSIGLWKYYLAVPPFVTRRRLKVLLADMYLRADLNKESRK